MDQLLWGGIVGVIASLVSSLVFMFALRGMKPKIKISDRISAYPKLSDPSVIAHRIKIVNMRRRATSDVSVRVYLQREFMVNGGPLTKNKRIGAIHTMQTIPARNPKDPKALHAQRINLASDLLEIWDTRKDYHLVVTVFARDEISGVGKEFEQIFSLGRDAITRGSFRHGDSLEINVSNTA